MKILLLGNAYFAYEFRTLGHSVLTWTMANRNDIRLPYLPIAYEEVCKQFPSGWEPDCILLGDHSTHPLILGLERAACPVVWYAIDSHVHMTWHATYTQAFDLVFVAQRDCLKIYQVDAPYPQVHWLPLFASPDRDHPVAAPRSIPLVFVGTLNPQWNPRRVRLIEQLRQQYPIEVGQGRYTDLYSHAGLVLNQSVANDLNFRVFEIMACGRPLLTERIGNGLLDLFKDRTHLITYAPDRAEEVIDLATYYNAHPHEREAIAEAGHAETMRHHTAMHRATQILEILHRAPLHAMVQARLGDQRRIERALIGTYSECMWNYANWPDPRFHATYQQAYLNGLRHHPDLDQEHELT